MPTFAADDPLATPQRLDAEPDPHFWEDGLGFLGFRRSMNEIARAPDVLFHRLFGDGENAEAARDVLRSFGDSTPVRANLMLAAAYVAKMDTPAIVDAARIALGEDAVAEPDSPGRRDRGALAARIAAASLGHLFSARALDDWRLRKRVTIRATGQHRVLTAPIPDLPWRKLAAEALRAMGAQRGKLALRSVVARPWAEDVLLGFRDRGGATSSRDDDDHFQPGHKEDWVYVRFFEKMDRAHVSAFDPERARVLAGRLATALWDATATYEWARDPLTPDRMMEFHDRLVNPSDKTFRLLEVVAELPGLWRRPVLKLGNHGQERVEPALVELWSAKVGFARDYATVLRVKMGFSHAGHVYRIELHYPEDPFASELPLAYTSRGVSPEVGQALQSLFESELGVCINPRSLGDATGRSSPYAKRPSEMAERHWTRLLGSTVDNPANWELDELKRLTTQGLIGMEERAAFRCGSPAILARPENAPEGCTGVVVGEVGSVRGGAPFAQPAGLRLSCSRCSAIWPSDQAHLPWFHQIVVHVDERAVWPVVRDAILPGIEGANRRVPGVLAWHDDEGQPCVVISADTAPEEWREIRHVIGRRAAWITTSAVAAARYGDRGVMLARALASPGGGALRRALDAGPVPADAGAGGGAAILPPPPYLHRGTPTGLPVVHIQRGDDRVYLGDQAVVEEDEHRLFLFFAVLQYAEEARARDPAEPEYTTGEVLAAYINDTIREIRSDPSIEGDVSGRNIHDWVVRARKVIDERARPTDQGALVIESPGTQPGYRVGPRYKLQHFSLRDEVRRYKGAGRPASKGSKR